MKMLTVEQISRINEKLYEDSLTDKSIEYSGRADYKIDLSKLEKLVHMAPRKDLLETATYYLKNLILLQAYPNGNHRTAVIAVEVFLDMNEKGFEYTVEEVLDFHKRSFTIQNRSYGSLEARGTSILNEKSNEFFEYCKKFISDHLTEGH